ncbi:PASTA domain-containing protein [Polaribacter dokdonensis]|jgi:eukaryotic-like serine/threonine-protein kinase|uniref:PASTA domain-containing protein n=1 Tax=Polaribacter dokdonensis DSW-5 TaxID=1300348 RepID=A0A0N0CES8_9FLAO|nr:PASTA domain-containing protein [Polaribacter dokdonensis]KOY50820.1 Serine/threonine protein kinase [Polaribacter dokdonensis DSW-5]SEE25320.1 PASTA domain-containing protein [Polaribacter dokdonensis DSW-5]
MGIFQFLKSKSFFKQLVIAVVSFVLLFFILKFWLNVTTNHDQKIQVPDLHKMTISEAERKLNELDLAYKVIDSASYNPEYPKKSVIEQSPEGGDFVKENRKIYLTLNPSKYRDITIPDLNGRTKRQAISELKAIGFVVGTKYTYVKDIGKDVVRGLRHNNKIVNPNDKLPKNSIIELVLGDGNR